MMRRFLSCAVCWLGAIAGAAGQCVMDWAPGFGVPGVAGSQTVERVSSLTVFDDGRAAALYVGGNFDLAGDVVSPHIAKWDGVHWAALRGELDFELNALVVWDDGLGPALYGGMQGGVAKWSGEGWQWLPGGVSYACALAVYDDGAGPALYAGGDPSYHDPYNSVVRWDGSTWQPLGSGLFHWDFETAVYALAVYDDGTGPALYVGGHFTRAGEAEVYNIAKWDGANWSPVGDFGVNGDVDALRVYDHGHGPALYAGGYFTYADYAQATCVAKWDGVEWSALGEGVGGVSSPAVLALDVFDDGTGPALVVGGKFTTAGSGSATCIARWDGTTWSALGSGFAPYWPPVLSLAVYDDGHGPALYAGGEFSVAGGIGAHHVARWDGTRWTALGGGNGLNDWVLGLAPGTLGDGSPAALYVAGPFVAAGGVAANQVARWGGTAWSALGAGTDGWARPVAIYDDGRGPALYVGGSFTHAGDVSAAGIARWDGTSWSALGSGIEDGGLNGLGAFDDGRGAALYATGLFTIAGGVPANNIARWDGQSWSALGNGLTGPNSYGVSTAVFDDGTGPALYVAGSFTTAGGLSVRNIARWDGHSWSALGSGLGGGDTPVYTLAVFDDGGGPALYAGGDFATSGTLRVNYIAKWDGHTWSALGGGEPGMSSSVFGMAVLDDGTGPALYVTGHFTSAGGVAAHRIAKWDGRRWWALGSGLDSGTAYELAAVDDGNGPALYVGGSFLGAGGKVSARIAKWGCVPGLTVGDADCDGVVDNFDIHPFVLALCRPEEYAQQYPACDRRTADTNRDGLVNDFDITPFVHLLVGK